MVLPGNPAFSFDGGRTHMSHELLGLTRRLWQIVRGKDGLPTTEVEIRNETDHDDHSRRA